MSGARAIHLHKPRWLAALCLAIAVSARCADTAIPAEAGRLELFVGDTRLLEVDATRVAVGSGKVVSARQVDGHKVLLLGEAAGTSALQVWQRDGTRQRWLVDVLEFDGRSLLQQVLRLLSGAPHVSARLAGDRVVLEGQRVGEAERDRVAGIVKAYPGRVFDFIDRVGWDAMIHMQVSILEVRHSAVDRLGIHWDELLQGPSVQFDSNAAGRQGRVQWTTQLGSAIDLMRQRGDARLIAEPTLSCRSGGEAHFVAGGELPVPFTNGQGTPNVQYREYGVILDVRPAADDAGNVYARVEAEVSDIDHSVQVMGVPGILKRHSNTEVNVRAGETIVIAGLVSRSGSSDSHGLPGLGALPGAAPLFRSRGRVQQDSELVVFITPHIVSAQPGIEGDPDPGAVQLRRADELRRMPAPK